MTSGISITDWSNFALADWGQDVTLYVATKTLDNITGEERISYGGGVTIKGVFSEHQDSYTDSKSGLLKGIDAIFQAQITDTVIKNDRITAQGDDYIVLAVRPVNGDGSTHLYDKCLLALES